MLALEALLDFCHPQQNIWQLLRNFIADLNVFGDAFIEVVWWGSRVVALYSLDCPTTRPITDEHGAVSGFVQVTDSGHTYVAVILANFIVAVTVIWLLMRAGP